MSLDQFGTSLSLKTVDRRQRLISGWAAYHSNVDRVQDIIDPAASVKAVNRLGSPSDVAVFVGHQANTLPVGIPQKIVAEPAGLYTETYILKGPVGDNLLDVAEDLLAHGQKLGMSIGYQPMASMPERSAGKLVRRLTDYSLKEYSYAASQMIANPLALTTGVKALSEGSDTAGGYTLPADVARPHRGRKAGMDYRIEQRGDRYHVIEADDGSSLISYGSEAEAKAAVAALKADAAEDASEGDDASKTVWDSSYVNDLADTAFLTIEPGGVKDDDGKTTPRSLRHFPYKDAAGAIDLPHLRNALSRIPQAGAWLDDAQKSRLQTRARTLLDKAGADKTVDGAAAWKVGTAPLDVRGFSYRLLDLSDALAAEHQAMTLLGESTKDGLRIRAEMRHKIAAVAADITKALTWAETIDKGEDGIARLALLARELELLEV